MSLKNSTVLATALSKKKENSVDPCFVSCVKFPV